MSARHQRSCRCIPELDAGETTSEVSIIDKHDLTYQGRQGQPENESHIIPKRSRQRRASAMDVHSAPHAVHDPDQHISRAERLVSRAYTLGDNDLARDNLKNDLPDADLQDL